ncbi:MAG: NifU N-terminal domain-containing protein [Caldilineaceae bacterium]
MQPTPNPNARKYILSTRHFTEPQNFSTPAAAADHPLAARLFALGTIYNVFMVQDFVTVNKLPDVPWERVEDAVQAILREFFKS